MASPARQVFRSQENIDNDCNDGTASPSSPPKPPRTAFMCFSDSKAEKIGRTGLKMSDDVIQLVAKEWKNLSTKERGRWDEAARRDKLRYVRQKSAFKGPWDLPKRRAKKNPLAPKRPMSAFLMFSQNRRKQIKEDNPDMENTDVSRLLGAMWRKATEKEKETYVEEEKRLRDIYKKKIADFRANISRADAASRTHHQDIKITPSRHHSQDIFKPRESSTSRSHNSIGQPPPPLPPPPPPVIQQYPQWGPPSHGVYPSQHHYNPYTVFYGNAGINDVQSFDSFMDSIPPNPSFVVFDEHLDHQEKRHEDNESCNATFADNSRNRPQVSRHNWY